MERQELIELLGRQEAFAVAPEPILARLVDAGEICHPDPDAELIRQGEVGGFVWILLEGALEIRVDGAPVNRVDSPGTVVGEISAVSLTAATATVKCDGETSVLRIRHDALHRIMEDSPEMAASVLRSMAKYLDGR